MLHSSSILCLPSSLLALIAASSWPVAASTNHDWPNNLPPHVKYWPEQEAHIKRDLKIQKQLAWHAPAGVRKMSGDEGEKFYLEYWQFGGWGLDDQGHGHVDTPQLRRKSTDPEDQQQHYSNISIPIPFEPPFPVHANPEQQHLRFLPRNIFRKRTFNCPVGTNSCASVNRPNSCCTAGELCIIVTDTGLGDVGCCPAGTNCAGPVAGCDTAAGYTSCPNSQNGVTSFPPTSIASASTSTSSSSSSQGLGLGGTVTITATPSTSKATTSLIVQSPLTCSPGFNSCAASLGGGCCATDRACGAMNCPPLSTSSPTSTDTAAAPFRPTSGTETTPVATMTTTTSTATFAATTGTACPTGFYMCSAYYLGGCCRVGRDCNTTSCPPASTTTIVVSNAVTVVAPPGASVGSSTDAGTVRSCANGWSSCAAAQGGGCCPSGYGCGASCTATAGGQNVGKIAPSTASTHVVGWGFLAMGIAMGVGMVVL
ncbi:hypothetical protein BJ546DRAFT_840197 [Cryomyces antarcticus]